MDVMLTSRAPALLLGLIALVLAGLTLPAEAATRTGAVKGVVTLDGKPLKGVRVELWWTDADGYEGPRLGVDTTDSKGAYSFSKFPIKDRNDSDHSGKTILVKDPSRRIVNTSRTLRDRAGRTVTRNASVVRGGSITGTVRRGDGAATTRLRTDVFGPYVLIDRHREVDADIVYDTSLMVAENGSFALKGLPAGDYYLQFVDEGKRYFSQCYDDLPAATHECDGTFNTGSTPSGTKITVARGQDVAIAPQTMSARGSRISGTVTDTSGRPLTKVRVRAVEVGQPRRLTTDTSKRGTFTLGPATDGTYRLEVAPRSPWAAPGSGATFTVDGRDVTGLAVELRSRARIAAELTGGDGTVTTRAVVTRAATGSRPSGTATFRWGSISKTVRVVKGRAAAKLSGLPKGTRTITVSYSGTRSTASATKTFRTKVR